MVVNYLFGFSNLLGFEFWEPYNIVQWTNQEKPVIDLSAQFKVMHVVDIEKEEKKKHNGFEI